MFNFVHWKYFHAVINKYVVQDNFKRTCFFEESIYKVLHTSLLLGLCFITHLYLFYFVIGMGVNVIKDSSFQTKTVRDNY